MEEIKVAIVEEAEVPTPYGFLCGILCASGILC